MTRGEIYRLSPSPGGDPKRSRCYVIVSRQTLIDSKADRIICAPINTRSDGLATQVPVGPSEGLEHDSSVNCDQLVLIEKARLTNYVGTLSGHLQRELREALRVALDVE
jgi:mRNA interferase MazF